MRIKIVTLAIAVFLLADAVSAAPPTRKFGALAVTTCTIETHSAFDVLIAAPGNSKFDSVWMRLSFGFYPASELEYTARFDNIYLKVYLDGIKYENLTGSVTFPRIDDRKNVKGTFELQTPTGEHITGRFDAPWFKPKMKLLCLM